MVVGMGVGVYWHWHCWGRNKHVVDQVDRRSDGTNSAGVTSHPAPNGTDGGNVEILVAIVQWKEGRSSNRAANGTTLCERAKKSVRYMYVYKEVFYAHLSTLG